MTQGGFANNRRKDAYALSTSRAQEALGAVDGMLTLRASKVVVFVRKPSLMCRAVISVEGETLDYESPALTAELQAHICCKTNYANGKIQKEQEQTEAQPAQIGLLRFWQFRKCVCFKRNPMEQRLRRRSG
jgi:hypothetical protein